MNMNRDIMIIIVVALGTILTRALPFIIFNDPSKKPALIDYLSKVLPYSVMAMLVVYCLKDINFFDSNHGLPEIIAISIIIVVHLLKNNTLLSIIIGTISYMICVQMIFI